ncbi:MAG: XRE family transcriptional regulator [Eubacteriaceae bacterium]|nr:XRE family transcriptional regulator [Eubacteriaceae bacterium]
MDYIIESVAERIRSIREILEISIEEMADVTKSSVEEYTNAENGKSDFSFTFLYLCAERFNVDLMELVSGVTPKLSFYSIVRAGKGLDVKRRSGLNYKHMAYSFKNKIAEPFLVRAPYLEEEQDAEIQLSRHEGQEMNFVLSGSMKMRFEDNTEILNEGDCVYYDSGRGHGMIATGGADCVFLAIVMKNS